MGNEVLPEYFLGVGDELLINTGGVETAQVAVVSPDEITLNTTMGNTVSNVVYIVAPDYSTDFDYEIITVE